MADKGIPIDASDDLDNLTALGVYTFVRTGIPQNAPPDLADGGKVYVVAGNSAVALRQKIVSVYGVEYNRTQNDPSSAWRAWTKTALATPPQEFDLSPADGWTHTHTWDKSCYCKTQENIVIVHFALDNSNATQHPDAAYVIAYLPEGFRPSAAVIGTCGDYNHSGTNLYQCWVTTDGAIIVYSPAAAPKAASGTLVFVADS